MLVSMGWLKRILSIAGSEEADEEPEKVSVELSRLSDWVSERSDAGFRELKPDIEKEFGRLFQKRKEMLHDLEELRTAGLQNPNISEREKQLMEGNRNSYISMHKQFSNMLNISDDISCRETLRFCEDYDDLIVKLAKSTAKGHAVMNEFFANHASSINKDVKAMTDSVSRIKELLEEGNVGADMIGDVQKSVDELRSKRKLLSELSGELVTLRKKLDNSDFMKRKLQRQIDELKRTDEYSEFQDRSDERDRLWKKVNETKEKVEALFSHVNKPMRKFERILAENVDLFNDYLDDPMSALVKDSDLKILTMLEKMKFKLMDGTLEVKDSDKAVQRIGDITKEDLEQARKVFTESRSAIKAIDDDVRNSKVLADIDDLKYKIEHTDNQVQILQDKIADAERTVEKIDLDSLRKEVQARILDAFDVEVSVVWQEEPSLMSSRPSSSE